jgi:hypothetical protein
MANQPLMAKGKPGDSEDGPLPIFIVADDDRKASDELVVALYSSPCFLVPVLDPTLVIRYARKFGANAVFMADRLSYPRGGPERLLQEILDRAEKPVFILAEDWTPENAERWKRMGARECLPHPTRTRFRLDRVRLLIRDFAVTAMTVGPVNAGSSPDERTN